MAVNLKIETLGDKFQDYRDPILGDSYNWGPVINAANVQYFAFHHSVTRQTAKVDGDWRKECDFIASLHVNQGWDGIGYRFVICSDGTVAYVGDLSHGGSAVTANNHIIFSACFVGDFTKELPTAQQVHSAHLLAKWFIEQMPQYPQINSWDDIIGHGDAATLLKLPGATPTACPGSNWRAVGDSLRDRIITDHWQGYPDPSPVVPPTSTPTPPVEPPAPDPKDAELEKARADIDQLTLENKQLTETTNRLSALIQSVKNIVFGKGYIWQKIQKLKEILS